jgi:hypothetical protein
MAGRQIDGFEVVRHSCELTPQTFRGGFEHPLVLVNADDPGLRPGLEAPFGQGAGAGTEIDDEGGTPSHGRT